MPITSLRKLPEGLLGLVSSQTQITELPELPKSLTYLDCQDTPLLLQRKAKETIEDYNKRWHEWREEKASKKRIQERNGVMKEDLMMAAWHPNRMEKWLEAGYDPDE